MTDEELAAEPGGVATRPDDAAIGGEQVFTPKDFRLDLRARLEIADDEPLPNLDSPAIRKLTWEHVVPDRPVQSTPSAATIVPLPPPSRVPPPLPPRPAMPLQPPQPVIIDEERFDGAEPINEEALEEVEVEEVELEEVELEEAAVEAGKPMVVEQPEINRLATVPDLFDDDDETPIELPPITPSGPGPVVVVQAPVIYAPVLSENFYVPPPQRPATTTVAAIVADGKAGRGKSSGKKKGNLLRTFVTLVLLFGLLGGGAFAAKKYLLHVPTWSADIKPLADDVAAARGLQFTSAVGVDELPATDYATRLATSTIGAGTTAAPMWRAFGVLNGDLDLGGIGTEALPEAPAFYDSASKSIVVADDLKAYEHLYRFAMDRALTAALLDQQFQWSARVSGV
ncbi:MAG TPA: hypothetical protein VFE86_00735, partial [Ilumatobacteraceae bacterium]|nr:hypothetical protein [Ilumatobacteraceae bacterium]